MPFKRRFRKKKQYVTKAQVNKMIESRQETKYYQSSWNAATIADQGIGGRFNALLPLVQGDDFDQRIGNTVLCTGLFGKLYFSAADTTNVVRCIIYIAHDISDTLSTLTVHGLPDPNRFAIIYDKMIVLNSSGADVKALTIAKKFNRGRKKGIQVQFDADTATDHTKNDIQIMFVSDSGVVSHPTVSGTLRTYYKDA